MNVFSLLALIGGLALFLYGMKIMGDGLEKQAGGSLKNVLKKMTSNPFKGMLLGAGVTAIIQSSSATTVMLVGFVNSGIMQLGQAIGVIMGANVGTTVTAWLLSLTAIPADSLLLQMLKPVNFVPILAIIGVIFLMFTKKEKFKDAALILLGFSILIFGMNMMSGAVAPLADDPQFASFLTVFSNPLFGILAGTLITAIIQSSSASVGILQALSLTGSITYATAIPIIIGQNIGTCVTALLASIGANKDAKRVAIVHLFFNIIGAGVLLTLFYVLNAIFQFSFMSMPINAAEIAIVHSVFNICATAILLPFTKQLEKLAYIVIKDTSKKQHYQLLDERLFATPAVAISQAKRYTSEMADGCQQALYAVDRIIRNYNDKDAAVITKCENKLDRYEDEIGSYLIELSAESLTAHDSREVSKLLHSIGDFERISDHAIGILKILSELHAKEIDFSDEAKKQLLVLSKATIDILSNTAYAFAHDDTEAATHIEPLEQVIDYLRSQMKRQHIERLQNNVCTLELGISFLDILTDFERIADHCSNIGACIIQIKEHRLAVHEYLNAVKNNENAEFIAQYEEYFKKYSLS